MRKLFRLAAAGALLASPALAADFPVYDAGVVMPPHETPFTWTGLYFGVHGGFGWAKDTSQFIDIYCPLNPIDCNGDTPVVPFDHDGGFIGGAHVGYNHQFANGLVIGAETDLDLGKTYSGPVWWTPEEADELASAEMKTTFSGSARLRAGVGMGRWLPFVTGGVAFAKYDAAILCPDCGEPNPFPRHGSGSLVGWAFGAGVNYAIHDNFILGLEYRGTHFGSGDVLFTNPDDTQVWNWNSTLTTNDIRASASVKF